MRFGQNPHKMLKTTVTPPAEISVGVLSHIPEQVGYYSGIFDSMKLCLASIRAHADQHFDLLVADNGSCSEVRDYLLQEHTAGRIQYLILNGRNVGKANAVQQILHAAPGDYVFYTDGDIYFKPGWMQAHLEIIKAYPNVGLVGGIPLRNIVDYFTAATLRWVERNRDQLDAYETGHLIPEEWIREFLRSIGSERFFDNWQHLQETRIVYQGVTAYVGASHMQFLISRNAIDCLPRKRFELALHSTEDQLFDKALDEAGLLRLSAAKPYVYHIGNTLTADWLLDEYRRLVQAESDSAPEQQALQKRHWFWGRWSVRRILRAVYEWSFNTYYRNA